MSKTTTTSPQEANQATEQIAADHSMPTLPLRTIFAMTFGCIGVNMAFTLQGSQMSRITQTIGVNPNSLGFFFLLPPLLGMIVQRYWGNTLTKPGLVGGDGFRTCFMGRPLPLSL